MKYKGSHLNLQYKYLGREPEYDGSLLEGSKLLNTYNWYSQMMDFSDSEEFISDYCLQNNIKTKVKNHHLITYGWIARILSKGGKINDNIIEKFHSYLESLNYIEDIKEEKPSKIYNDPLDDIMPLIDEIIYNNHPIDLNYDISKRDRNRIIEKILPIKNELESEDPQILESYSNFSKSEIKGWIININKLISYIDKFENTPKLKESIKVIRSNNKKASERQKIKEQIKAKKMEAKKFKDFKYLEEDKSLGIKSIDPKKIIGSSILYLFDTNKNTFYKLVSQEGKSLDINRTTIINIDENKSEAKKIGRNTKEELNKFILSNKRGKEKFLESIKTKLTKISSRTSMDYIILGTQ